MAIAMTIFDIWTAAPNMDIALSHRISATPVIEFVPFLRVNKKDGESTRA